MVRFPLGIEEPVLPEPTSSALGSQVERSSWEKTYHQCSFGGLHILRVLRLVQDQVDHPSLVQKRPNPGRTLAPCQACHHRGPYLGSIASSSQSLGDLGLDTVEQSGIGRDQSPQSGNRASPD